MLYVASVPFCTNSVHFLWGIIRIWKVVLQRSCAAIPLGEDEITEMWHARHITAIRWNCCLHFTSFGQFYQVLLCGEHFVMVHFAIIHLATLYKSWCNMSKNFKYCIKTGCSSNTVSKLVVLQISITNINFSLSHYLPGLNSLLCNKWLPWLKPFLRGAFDIPTFMYHSRRTTK